LSAGTSRGPLAGLRVLDLTSFLSGPFGTQILGDLGAEVLKVEPPLGDNSRSVPPHQVDGESVYYLSANRNKKSVVIDLKDPGNREFVIDLAKRCDIVVENSKPGALARMGLDYETVSSIVPEIIWCAISGFGQDGPYRDRPAYDMIVQAYSGGMSLTGERGGVPVRAGVPIGDLTAGLYGVIGVLAALEQRRRTGRGDYIDISMLDCQVALLSYQAAYFLHSGEVPGTQGRSHDSIPTYRCFRARDGLDVAVTANTERMWQNLCQVLGLGDLPHDVRFKTPANRYENSGELVPLLEKAFLSRTADEWVERLNEAGIPVAPVNALDRALSDPQVLHRRMVLELTRADGSGSVRVAGNPLRFRSAGDAPAEYPPRKGEHDEYARRFAEAR
jgi:crotonobetainyl-CoA:carnitine CoA-transferase CaiB-like acyl-CoA transferase